MKTMTCNQLGGACDLKFHADTFEQMGEQSKNHSLEMAEKNDEDHLKAMSKMQKLMKDSKAMQDWFDSKRKEFDSLPED